MESKKTIKLGGAVLFTIVTTADGVDIQWSFAGWMLSMIVMLSLIF